VRNEISTKQWRRYVYIQSVAEGLAVLCTKNCQNWWTYNEVAIGWKVARIYESHQNATTLNISVSWGSAAAHLGVADSVIHHFVGNLTGLQQWKNCENRLIFDEILVTRGWRVFLDTVYISPTMRQWMQTQWTVCLCVNTKGRNFTCRLWKKRSSAWFCTVLSSFLCQKCCVEQLLLIC